MKRRRARTLAEWALVLDVLEDKETVEEKESEVGDGPRVKRTRQVHPRSDFSQAPWFIMLSKLELKTARLQRVQKLWQHISASRTFLERVQLAKHQKCSHWLQGTWQEGSIYL